MAGSIIKIKRSPNNGIPGTLATGELAYSWGVGGTGGEQLFIGYGTETAGVAANIAVIGGKYFTDMLDHTRGTLTASSAIVVDADSKINQLKTTNITIGGAGKTNEIGADGSLTLYPSNGTVYIGSMYSLPTTRTPVSGYVLTGNTDGSSTWSAPSTSLYISGDTGDELKIDILTETFEIGGDSDQGVYTIGYAGSVGGYTGSQGNNLNISVRNAGYNGSKGVASFNENDFSLSTGNVSLGGSVPRFFTGNDVAYIGSNGAKTTNGEIKIKGNTTTGIQTTVVNGDTIQVEGMIPSASQRGTAKFSSTYFDVNQTDGTVTSVIAGNNNVGVAKFPDTQFTVDAGGKVEIVYATDSIKGIASFDNTYFTVEQGVVKAKSVYLGTTELVLGEGSPSAAANADVTGLSSAEIGNIKISVNKIESFHASDANKDILLAPKGTGKVKINETANQGYSGWYLPGATAGSANDIKGFVLTYNDDHTTSWQRSVSELRIRDGALGGTISTVNLLENGVSLHGDSLKGITTSVLGYTGSYLGLKVSANYAGYTGSTAATANTGVSSFYSDTFVIDEVGGVNIKSGGVSNSQLANSSLTVGTTTISLGGTATTIGGLVATGYVGSLSISGYDGSFSTITSPQSIHLNSTGTGAYQGYVKIGTDAWNLPNGKGNADQVLTSDGVGSATWQSVPRVQFIDTDGSVLEGGYVGSFKLGTDLLTIVGDGIIHTDYTGSSGGNNNTIHIGVDIASTAQLGVAKFNSADFVVSNGGEVETVGEFLKSVSTNQGTTALPYSHNLKVLGYTGSASDPRAGAIFTVGYGGSNSSNPDGAKVDIVARVATDALAGIASFNSSNFTITDGNVTSKKFTIGNIDFNLGSATVTALTGLTSVTVDDIQIYDNVIQNVNSNIAVTNADIVLQPKGQGTVNVSGARISGLGTPSADTDAVTKIYADALASGLDVKLSVRLATTRPLPATYTTTFGYLGSAGNREELTNAGTQAELSIDGFTVVQGDRILVKDQGIVTVNGTKFAVITNTNIVSAAISNNEITLAEVISAPKGTKWKTPVGFSGVTNLAADTTYYIAADVVSSKKITLSATYADAISASPTVISISGTPTSSGTLIGLIGDNDAAKANGIYVVSNAGTGSTNWVLTRSADADETAEVNAGMFTFIEEGNIWADAGFILITDNPISMGVTPLVFTQFSSAGRTLAGDGLLKVGDNINIVADQYSGITVNADSIEISSTISGQALDFTNGVLNVRFDNTTIGYTGSVDKKLRIHESYPGQTSITTLGTIATGTWNADTISVTKGGTGLTSIAAGSILYSSANNTLAARTATNADKYKFLMVSGNDAMPVWSDIDGGEY